MVDRPSLAIGPTKRKGVSSLIALEDKGPFFCSHQKKNFSWHPILPLFCLFALRLSATASHENPRDLRNHAAEAHITSCPRTHDGAQGRHAPSKKIFRVGEALKA